MIFVIRRVQMRKEDSLICVQVFFYFRMFTAPAEVDGPMWAGV